MAEVKALFPIGKTQWRKWRPEQKIAFNETREAGVPFNEAVEYVNRLELIEVNIAPPPPPKKNVLDVIEDVIEVAAPMVAAAKTVAKVTKKKGK